MNEPASKQKAARVALAKIDPDGYVSATWRTWCLLGAILVTGAIFYRDIQRGLEQTEANTAEIQIHRETLIKAGLLPAGGNVAKGGTP